MNQVSSTFQAVLTVIVICYPVFFLFDYFYLSRRPGLPPSYRYDATSLFANSLVLVFRHAAQALTVFPYLLAFRYVRSHAISLFDVIQNQWVLALLAFLISDFVFYCWHRASHTYRPLWLAHQIHHQDTQFNFGTSMRLGILETVSMLPFFVIALFLGLSPELYFGFLRLCVFLMPYLHCSIERLPKWMEFVFNTPSHHRLHHKIGTMAGRCNYGALLIIWDRIFSTFELEVEPVTRFGVSYIANDFHPVSDQWARFPKPGEKLKIVGHKLFDLFGISELVAISMVVTCFSLPVGKGNHLWICALFLCLIYSQELYPRLKQKSGKALFWVFNGAAALYALSTSLQIVREGVALTVWFWCLFWIIPLFLVCIELHLKKKKIPVIHLKF